MSPSAASDGLDLGEIVTDAGGHRAELVVAPGSPWLAGHFPGHPMLPGIAQLAVADRLHHAAEERGQLAGVDAMRFAAPAGPGDRLVARLTACDENGRARWRLERAEDGGEVATGTLVWGSPSADAVADPPEPIGGADDGAPAALPHAGSARLVERFVLHRPSSVIAAGTVPAAHAAVADGRAPAFLAIELAAQAAAQVPLDDEAADGEGAAAQPVPGEPRLGYLVRMRDVRFARARVEAGAPLLVHVDLAGRTGPLARFDFTVVLPGGEPVAGGSLATWRVADES